MNYEVNSFCLCSMYIPTLNEFFSVGLKILFEVCNIPKEKMIEINLLMWLLMMNAQLCSFI